MALSNADKLLAGKWFVRNAWKKTRKPARSDIIVLAATITSVDDWFDASPAGDVAPSRVASLIAALPTAFDNNSDATEKAMMVAAVALARAGEL